jgi:archaemetzincin
MAARDTIIISPVGKIPSWVCSIIMVGLTPIFGFKTEVFSVLDDIEFAYNADRDQYHSTLILDELEKRAPDHCVKIMAVTQEDLFIPILTHVYGEAQLGGRACIVSIFRLLEDAVADPHGKGRDRIVKEAAHELGHTFDLRHCDDSGCIMHYCRKIEDVDHKSERFCRYCTVLFNDSVNLLEK